MTIHKEGYKIILTLTLILLIINLILYFIIKQFVPIAISSAASLIFLLFVIRFFREPYRPKIEIKANQFICPADGTVVVIEETVESEYFKDTRLQVSIFMSVWDVHINWFPINGIVRYFRHHHGAFLIARNPKSSTENERTSIVIQQEGSGIEILMRQIAGFIARRIVCNAVEGKEVKRSSQVGFIKFGSRVDLFLPLGTKIDVTIGQHVTGNKTIIGEFNQ